MKGSRSRLTLVIGALALVALMLISWFAILSPRLSYAAQVQQEADQVATANLSLLNQYNGSVDQAKKAPDAAREAQALFATMPQQADLPSVIEQITAAAVDAGIDPGAVGQITTSVPTRVDAGGANAGVAIATMTIGISAAGTRDQLLAFIDNLQALDRALLITDTQMALTSSSDVSSGPKSPHTLQVGGTMFVLQSGLPDLVDKVNTALPKDVLEDATTSTATETPASGA